MSRQSASTVIDRTPEEVFAYMDDVSLEGEWQPNLHAAEQDPPGQSKVGTHKRYVTKFLGREVANTYVVTDIEPGRRVVYETTKDSTITATSEITWERIGSGTKVTMVIEGKPKGALKLIPRKVLEAAYRERLESALESLKERLETGA